MMRIGTKRNLRVLGLLAVVGLMLPACGAGAETTTTLAPAPLALGMTADVVWGPLNIPDDQKATQVCVLGSRFPRNSEIVWRLRVTDPVTGEGMSDEMLTTVQVKLSDGQVLDMSYRPHPKDNPTDYFWTVAFDVPVDYPTGNLGYEIVAVSGDGRTGTFAQFNVAPSLLTITDEVLETIEGV